MPSVKQDNFSGGEIAPALQANTKLTKRKNGLALCRNFLIDRHGIARNRAGTEYIREVDDSSNSKVRLIPFILNNDIKYQIEIDHQQIKVHDGSTLKDTVDAPWSLGDAPDLQFQQSGNIITVVDAGNGYPPYEIERVSDTDWTVTLKSGVPTIDAPKSMSSSSITAGSNTYVYAVTAVDKNGNESLPGTSATKTSAGMGPLGGDYEVYDFTVQSTAHGLAAADKVQIEGSTHLTMLNKHSFTIKAVDTNDFTLEDIDLDSLVAEGTYKDLQSQGATNPCLITTTGPHGYSTGNTVYISGAGMTEINDTTYAITVVDSTSYTLDGIDATSWVAGTGGYSHLSDSATLRVYPENLTVSSAAAPSSSDPHVISWNAVTGAVEYNVYRQDDSGTFGLIGISTEATFSDIGTTPDTELRPPRDALQFLNSEDWPAAVGSFQQRIIFGNTTADVEILNGSRIGGTDDFTLRVPAEDDDPFEHRLIGRQTNEVRHILDIGRLIVLTQGGIKLLQGDANGTVTNANPNIKQVSYRGAAQVRPIIVGNKALFVERDGRTIRDLSYEFESDGYVGVDLTTFASHLLDGDKVIVDWCYQQSPNSTIWIIVDDKDWSGNRSNSDDKTKNMLIALTYIPEQEIWAFHRHDSQGGEFESICCTPGDDGDDVYMIVKRTVDGSAVRYIERLNNRVINDVEIDAIFLDSYLTYDGRHTGATSMTLTTATTWDALVEMTLTASGSYFSAGKVGNKMHLRSVSYAFNAETGRKEKTVTEVVCIITAYTSATVVTVVPESDVPTALQSATLDWGEAVDTVSGLSHLEGETVRAVGDGNPIEEMTVSSGSVTIPGNEFYEVIHVGLPYNSDLETLPLDNTEGEALSNKLININQVTLEVAESRNFQAGPDSTGLKEFQVSGTDLYTGKRTLTIPCTWAKNGKIFIRQSDPLPLSVTGITLQGQVEGGE